MSSPSSLNQLLNELAQCRNFYKLKRNLGIGNFWRRSKRSKLKSIVKNTQIETIIKGEDNILYPTRSQDQVTNGILYRGDASKEIAWVIERYSRRSSLTIDIGCNLGFVAALMAKSVGDDGQVWCFEPNQQLIPHIKEIFWLNQWRHYQVFPVALSDNTGKCTFTIDENDHSMSKISHENATHSFNVSCHRLDDYQDQFNHPVSLIKIDVEGHEHNVLKGAIKTCQQHQPAIIFETGLVNQSAANAIDLTLTEMGYRVAGVIQDWGLIPIRSLAELNQSQQHVNVLALPQ